MFGTGTFEKHGNEANLFQNLKTINLYMLLKCFIRKMKTDTQNDVIISLL